MKLCGKLLKRKFERINISVKLFPNKSWFLRVCSVILLKTLWEKEKFALNSISFPFAALLPFQRSLKVLCTYSFGLVPSPNRNRIHSSLAAVHCFDNGYFGKQPVALKEYCAE